MGDLDTRCHVAVVDLPPIDPPTGGGRLRLLGLYHGLGENLPTVYVGSHDWPDRGVRHHRISPTLEEVDVPLSPAHFAAHQRWKHCAGGRALFDTTFDLLGNLSSDFIRNAVDVTAVADIVVVSRPWVYPLLRKHLKPHQLLVYDAHNVEGLLSAGLLEEDGTGLELAKHVVQIESELVRQADVTLACLAEDARLFERFYGVSRERIKEVPNGVFTAKLTPPTPGQKAKARATLGLSHPTALFLGSAEGPDVEAVQFLCQHLAPVLPQFTFVVCGGVCQSPALTLFREKLPNVCFQGFLTEEEKQQHLWAADVGVNPMVSGSGTHIQVLDFMAAGLPIVATQIGARGISGGDTNGLWKVAAGEMPLVLAKLATSPGLRRHAGLRARALACEKYSWEALSPRLGKTLLQRFQDKAQSAALDSRPHLPLSMPGPETAQGTRIHKPASAAARGVAFLSSWRTHCGIAEHSSGVIRALQDRGVRCFIVDSAQPEAALRDPADESVVVRVEDMAGFADREGAAVASRCLRAGVRHLVIQYHPDFFDEEALLRLIVECRIQGVEVTVTAHDTRKMQAAKLAQACNAGARLIVLHDEDAQRLQTLGAYRTRYIAHGALEVEDEDRAAAQARFGWRSGPVIGTFGLLRPSTGLAALIEAYALVLDVYPEAKLLALTALSPTEDSRQAFETCQSLLTQHGLNQNGRIYFDTSFHPLDDVIRKLHASDLIVLPHLPSDEGAGGSAITALCALRPVVTTKARVFQDTQDFTYLIESVNPLALALGCCNVLSSPGLRQHLTSRSARFIASRRWSKVGEQYEEAIFRGV